MIDTFFNFIRSVFDLGFVRELLSFFEVFFVIYLIGYSSFLFISVIVENQKSMLNDALLAEQNRKKCDLTLNTIVKFLSSLVGDINNPDTRRRLLEFFIDKIYVYPDKMVLTFYYTDDRRELPFEETVRLIDNRQKILDMMNSPRPEGVVPACSLEMPLDGGEEKAGFFL